MIYAKTLHNFKGKYTKLKACDNTTFLQKGNAESTVLPRRSHQRRQEEVKEQSRFYASDLLSNAIAFERRGVYYDLVFSLVCIFLWSLFKVIR